MDSYQIRELSNDEFDELWLEHGKKFFDNESQVFRLVQALSKEALAQLAELKSNLGTPIKIFLGIYYKNECVGWSWGFQESAFRFYMCNSAVFPKHRRKGLYTMLMGEMIKRVTELGFQEIYSKHRATNNSVLIAKLKAGFVINTLQVTDSHGVMVHLVYFPNKLRNKMLDYRVGQTKPDDEIKIRLGIE